MIQFHFCENFKKNTKNKDFDDIIFNKISSNKERVSLNNIGNISCFTGSIYVLKTTTPKARIIIEEKNINIDNEIIKVYFIREIIKNFDYKYVRIIIVQLKNGEWIKNNPLPTKDENDFIKEYSKKKIKINKERELPPQELTSWLTDFKLKLDNEIFESEDWVKYALNSSLTEGMIDKYVNTFRLVLEEITNIDNTEIIKEQNGIEIRQYINHNIGILYSKIQINTDKIVYLLHNGAHIEKQSEYWKETLNNIISNDIEFENNIESISRKAFRSYPKWTINKDELWFAIQKSTEMSNLSLTREQINFFKTFKFPYYINGQAGSGKSTMLYYLFANSYYYKCSGEIQGDIIFLTENETLLKLTKNSVFDLLTNNPEFSGLTIAQKNQSKNHFNSFKRFLLDMLPESDKNSFRENKYLDFSKFKQLYENSYLPKHTIDKYSAEESWFTIITYIYGYDANNTITSANYLKNVDDKSQIIPLDKFKGIEDKVLPFYEKLINKEAYWDKLKIIKYISNNIPIKKKYSVLICDEAQDFCRVELRFILRLSKYLEYDLSKIDQVPIVFAGDPNQTVNPTGFRQGEMTSMLYEELQEIARFEYNKEENIYNPSFNYRSTQPVVSIANFVQYHRMKNLGIKQVKPQEAKRPSSNTDKDFNTFLNYKTIDNDPDLKQDLVEKLKYKIFVIPVNAQEKEEYINKHNLLSLIDKVEVKTSVEAKGAEYEQVVLFGFGEYFINNFKNLSENKSNSDELFKRGFFFNKLYVGLTRAQTELIIIDNESSEELFWKKIVDNAHISADRWQILNNFKIKTIEYGTESIKNIIKSTPEDALKNAKKDKEQGLYDKNPARLKVAANQFFKIGNKEDGYECLALSEQIKENWKSASDFYLKPIFKYPKYEEAAICLFKGRLFNELISQIGNNLKSIKQDIRIIISRLINGEKIMKQDIDILINNKDKLNEIIKNLEWRDELIDQIILSSKSIQILEQKNDFVQIMESIVNSNDLNLWIEIGNIRFDLKHYKEAIDAWTEIDFFENNEKYYISQVEFSKQENDYENTVLWLDTLLKFIKSNKQESIYNEIIEIHRQHGSDNNSVDYFIIVFKAIILQKPDSDKVIEIGKKIEKIFVNEHSKLTEFYKKILTKEVLNSKIANFIVERWAKSIWKSKKQNFSIKELNNKYSQFSEKHNIIFKEFELEELKNISDFPENIKWKPSEQFKKITIHNFRRFKQITLSNIGQFNLIVGDNNVGKTSLLEALLFTTKKDRYIENLAFAYISRKDSERISTNNETKYKISTDFVIRDFVRKDAQSKKLIFELEEERNSWNYIIRNAKRDEIEDILEQITNIDTDEYISFISDNSKVEIAELPLIIRKINPENSIKSHLIPFGKGFGKDLALIYYENIEKIKSERNNFIESMKTFIPNIERINVNTVKGEIDIEEKDFEISAPLHQYGEGANKLFRILVQITLQKGKRLLIDEIDAGIHYSHFPTFWKTIIKVAHKNEVQIFATTHNLECVNYFAEILKEEKYISYQKESRIITLRELPDKTVKAYTRSYDEFEYELNNEFEIRGGDL
ncbi:MAG: AAA family ATPase [Bacteroidota bacterium]|nr:AAA family ATPase [Bacteroidota bacterium]